MDEGAQLSEALAFAAAAALVGGLIARRLGQSTLAGYVVAGVLLGVAPFGPDDAEDIRTLADVGVVLLMFSLGIQFDLRDLAAVQRTALPGAVAQVALTMLAGVGVGLLAGWSWRAGVVLGAAGAISSSPVIFKLLAERGEEESAHGRLAFGWSVAQDLITIVLVVLIGALAATGGNPAREIGEAVAVAVLFLGGMIVIGARVLPVVLNQIARTGSRELFILAIAVLSVGAALLSEEVGISLALGAFVAGLVLSEPDLSAQILGELLPTREIFAALFFVSIGLLVEPAVIADNALLFVALTVFILAVKSAVAAALVRLFAYPVRTALLTGAVLAASAEFSFVLATLGRDDGILTADQFGVIVAATSASIVVAPLLLLPIPYLTRRLASRDAPPADADEPAPVVARNVTIICGYGRVGALVGETLRGRGFRAVIIDTDRRLVERLRAEGRTAIYGNAGHPAVLSRAGILNARTLVVAIPDPIEARLVVQRARDLNPRLDIVARAAGLAEAATLRRLGVSEAVIPERELALELTRHTLHRLGLSTLETQAVVQALRIGG